MENRKGDTFVGEELATLSPTVHLNERLALLVVRFLS